MKQLQNWNAKKIGLLIAAIFVIAAVVVGVVHFARENRETYLDKVQQEALELLDSREGEYDAQTIVLRNTSPSEANRLAKRFNAQLRITADGQFATLTLPEGVTITDICADSQNRDCIEAMSADFYAYASALTDDSSHSPQRPQYSVRDTAYDMQGYLDYLNIGKAWDVTRGAGITVAVIDSGLDTDHPEFAGRISEYSYNATEDKILKDYTTADGGYDWSLIEDEQGHGTAVTGVIAAAMDGIGTVGIAPDVQIMVIKAQCNEAGQFINSSDLVYGIYHAIENGADIINMSFGGYDPENVYQDVLQMAAAKNVICVAAAGNDGTTRLCYPAADENVISVGAMEENSWNLAEYSNYGENVNIVAPGTTYTTAMGGEYKTASGTSLSCPTVVGGLALYLAQKPNATWDGLREMLYASCYDLGDPGEDWYYGYGAFDIHAMVCEGQSFGTVTFNMLTDELENIEKIFVRNHTLQDIPEPERTYVIFDGWYYDIDCTEPLNMYSDIFVTDITLYAAWTNEDDGVPYTYKQKSDGTIEILSYKGKRRYITIPEYIDGKPVTSIAPAAFRGETRLREVVLPAQLKTIGRYAFSGCSNLVLMNIPDTVTEIGEYAFEDNVRLTAVAFGENSRLVTIGNYAFYNCANLQRFEVPQSLESVNGTAFIGTASNRQFAMLGSNSRFFTVADGVLLDAAGGQIVAYPAGKTAESYRVPDSVRQIGICAFHGARLSDIDLNQVAFLRESAFEGAWLESLTIPDSVTSMEIEAFASNVYLESLVIGKGLDTVPAGAFRECVLLKSVHIPANITRIDGAAQPISGAFTGCALLKNLTFAENSQLTAVEQYAFSGCALEELWLPKTVETIGDNAFARNRYLRTVSFEAGSGLKHIGGSAFASDTSLVHVSLPEGLTTIDSEAFSDTAALQSIRLPSSLRILNNRAFSASSLLEVTLPAKLEFLGAGVFAACDYLENIFVDAGNSYYTDIDGVVYAKDRTIVLAYPVGNSRTSYTVADGTVKVGDAAFYGANHLTRVTLPSTVSEIGNEAFCACENMLSYSLPVGLTVIGKSAFAYNTSVQSYSLPANLTVIANSVFAGNTSLTSMQIPDNVQEIGGHAFYGNKKLHSITFHASSRLQTIGSHAFSGTGIYELRIPASVSYLGSNAFADAQNLSTITFAAGSSLETIVSNTFANCPVLHTIIFEAGSQLTSIEEMGFNGLSNLSTLNLTDTKLKSIGDRAFRYCQRLSRLTLPEGLESIGAFAFYGCEAFTSMNIPASIESIGENAFYLAEELNIYFAANRLPAMLAKNWDNGIRGYYVGVKTVIDEGNWSYAVLSDGGIAIVDYRGNEEEIDLSAFANGEVVTIGGNSFRGSSVKNIILPETLREIHRYAFAYTALESIKIPDSVHFIGQYAFCTSEISQIHFGDNAKVRNIEQYAFSNCKNLKDIKIPGSLETLGRYVFTKSALERVDFTAATLTELPQGAFMQTNLTAVTLPDSLTLIDHSAFRDCKLLTSVNFGTANLQLMSNVFYNTGLAELYIPDNLTYIGEYSFVGLEKLKAFEVSATHEKYTSINGLLFSKDGRKLIAAPAGMTGELTLPQSLEVLGFGAFENSKLTKINFHPESNILTFGYRCFYNSAIVELNVPKTVVSFDFYAFAMCKNLRTVRFAEDTQLKGIYEGAFYGCLNLENIVIPDSIVEISDYAFYGCISLKKLPVSEDSAIKCIYDYAFAYTSFRELTLPAGLWDIGSHAFHGAKLEKVEIPSDEPEYLVIGIGAFEECNNLQEITLPFIGASFEDLDISWFSYIFGAGGPAASNTYIPESLKTVTISEDIKLVGPNAFSGIGNVETLNLPHSITGLFPGAFTGVGIPYELTNAISFYTVDSWGNPRLSEWTINCFGSSLSGHLILADGLTNIGWGAFSWNSNLTGITIPPSVTSIGDDAFMQCNNLEVVNITDLAAWCAISFDGDHSNPLQYGELYLNGALVTELAIPDGVTSICDHAFEDCDRVTSVTIPDSVVSIGEEAFRSCSELVSVTVGKGVTDIGTKAFGACNVIEVINHSPLVFTIGSEDYGRIAFWANVVINADGSKQYRDGVECVLWETADGFKFMHRDGKYWLLAYLGEGDTVTLPMSANGEPYQISSLSGIKHVIVPEGMTDISSWSFGECESLESLYIPDSVTEYGDAFSWFFNLKEIRVGENNPALSVQDGILYDKEKTKIIKVFGEVSGEMVLPDTLVSIHDNAFSECYELTGVVIPDSVTTIGESAFSLCYNLSSVTIGSGVTKIGEWAFSSCEKLTEIVIPDSVVDLGNLAFSGCYGLKNVHIGSGVTRIGQSTFSECTSLETVTIAEDSAMKDICSYAFSGCTGLTQFAIPDRVTSVEMNAFSRCTGLKSLTIGKALQNIASSAFTDCNIESITVHPENRYCSFENGILYCADQRDICYVMESVTDVQVSAKVWHLGYAFTGKTNLASVTFEEGCELSSIGYDAFAGCTGLTSITIPESVHYIGGLAFADCTGLTSLVISENVSYIGDNAFSGCNLAITVDENNPNYASQDGVLYNKDKTEFFYVPKSITGELELPDSVTQIGYGAFAECVGLTGIIIPDSVTSIGNSAFRGCTGLTNVEIPGSVTSIGAEVFSGCTALTSITIPEGVTDIGGWAFSGCTGLLSVSIPASMANIGIAAFSECIWLYEVINNSSLPLSFESYDYGQIAYNARVIVNADGSKQYRNGQAFDIYDDANGLRFLYEDGVYTLVGYLGSEDTVTLPLTVNGQPYSIREMRGVRNVILPDGITEIGLEAFLNCSSLQSITIPPSVTSIGVSAFSGCTSLNAVYITNLAAWCNISMEGINSNPLYYAKKLYIDGVLATDIVIPEGVSSIGAYAFVGGIGLTGITIPEGVTGIGEGAFRDCINLVNVTIPDSVTSIGEYAFCNCVGLTGITIPEGVTSIGDSAFSGCAGLTDIKIPDGVTCINGSTFYGCSGLTSIMIPDGVTRIDGYAFSDCTGLKNITISDSVTSIGRFAFDGTAYFNDPGNWKDGILYIDEYLIAAEANRTVIEVKPGTVCIADDAFEGSKYTLKTVTLVGDCSGILRDFTNIQTLILLSLPTDERHGSISGYFGRGIPMTLKTIVLKEGCNVGSDRLFNGITGVNIFVETEKINVQWDYDYPNWNNGAQVYYGGEWIEAKFLDCRRRYFGRHLLLHHFPGRAPALCYR